MGNTKNLGLLAKNVIVSGSSNYIGVGTNTPGAKLDVNGDITADYVTSIQGVDPGNPTSSLDELRVSGYGIMGNRGGLYITNASDTGNIQFGIGGAHANSPKMYISSSGNIGIGTTSPTVKLDIDGDVTTTGILRLSKGASDTIQQGSSLYLVGGTGSSYTQLQQGVGRFTIWGFNGSSWGEKLTVRHSDGNVGIGETNPGYKLDVNGSIRSSTLDLGQVGLNIGGYNSYSQTISGVMGILGHNVKASSTTNNQVEVVNSGWYSSMIKQYYSEGITFHTSTTSYNAGDVYPISSTERMRVTANGNIGIGTTSPAERLSVNGNIEIQGIAGTVRYVLTNETNTGTGRLIFQAGGGSSAFGGALNLYANAHATKPGDVAIGLSGNGTSKFRINSQGLDGGTDLVTVLNSGNVGIGTTSPSQKLDVNGTVKAGNVSSQGFVSAHGVMKTFTATKSFNERETNADYFRISSNGAGFQVMVYTVAQNVGVGWSQSQVFQAVTAPYWGGWIGTGAAMSTIGSSAGYISTSTVGNDGTITFKISTGNNGTTTTSSVISYIQVTAFNIDQISFTQL
jgi:hypothetical protein